jgi:hypothetical protein
MFTAGYLARLVGFGRSLAPTLRHEGSEPEPPPSPPPTR